MIIDDISTVLHELDRPTPGAFDQIAEQQRSRGVDRTAVTLAAPFRRVERRSADR